MAGKRKILVFILGLAALLVLAGMVAWASLPVDAVGELAYAVVFLAGAYMGGNGLEHFASSTRSKPVGTAP
jgi:hypothetical protein